MDDLVMRLREGCSNHPFCDGCQDERSDAADEIERLRAAVEAERERCAEIAEIADEYARKEGEDVVVAGSSICFYSKLIAAAIRARGAQGETPSSSGED